MENLASKPADQLIMVPNCGRVSINPTALVTIKNNYAAKKKKFNNFPMNQLTLLITIFGMQPFRSTKQVETLT
jgi:hypothetical protein